MFGSDSSNEVFTLLDDISVVSTTNPTTELLINPSFESSSSTPTGWSVWCSSTCTVSTGGIVISSGCRSGMCFKEQCRGGSKVDYIAQTFIAISGQTYTISFWFQRVRVVSGSSGSSTLYVGII